MSQIATVNTSEACLQLVKVCLFVRLFVRWLVCMACMHACIDRIHVVGIGYCRIYRWMFLVCSHANAHPLHSIPKQDDYAKYQHENYAIWRGDSNNGCFVCNVNDRGLNQSQWKYLPRPGAISWNTGRLVPPPSDAPGYLTANLSVTPGANHADEVSTCIFVFSYLFSCCPCMLSLHDSTQLTHTCTHDMHSPKQTRQHNNQGVVRSRARQLDRGRGLS